MPRRPRSLSSPFASWREIDLRRPLADHPLNRGLVSWLLALPQWRGSTIFRNLLGRTHGTLTSMDPATDWQGARGRPGGWGCLRTDGVDGYVDVPFPAVGSGVDFSMAFWVLPGWTGGFTCLPDYTDANRYFSLFFDNATGNLSYSGGLWSTGSTAPLGMTNGTWWHLLMQRRAGVIEAYVNGSPRTMTAGTDPVNPPAVNMRFGTNPSGGGSVFDGRLDDVRLALRSYDAAGAVALYQQSSQFYPDLLRRHTPVRWGGAGEPPPPSGSLPPLWASYRRRRT